MTDSPTNDPGGVIGWLKTNYPNLYLVLWVMDKACDGLIFNDPDHTFSYHIAVMAQSGNPFGIVCCDALNALSPNHCQWALSHELTDSIELLILTRSNQIWSLVQQIAAKELTIMGALADLQAAEAGVATAIQAAITLIQQLQAGAVANADVEAVVTQLNTAAATLNAAVVTP